MSNNATNDLSIDIKALKANIKAAKQEIALANAEFKNATAGMDKWSQSTDGVKEKLAQLNKVSEQENIILKNLRDQYSEVSKEQGENSKEAKSLNIEIQKQEANCKNTQSSIKYYSDSLKDLEAASVDNRNTLEKLSDTIEDQEKALKDLKGELANAILEEGKGSDKADDLRKSIDNLNDELNENKKKLSDATGESRDLKSSFSDVDEKTKDLQGTFDTFSGVMSNLIASGIKAVIGGLKDLATETFNAGSNFESAMSQVGAISGASSEDMEILTAKAKEMGESTKFSATESADAFKYMAMAGWETKDMVNGIGGIMSLAAASGEDLARTSDIVTDALTAMGYSAGDAGHLADVMAAASSNANTNVDLMGSTFQYAAPIIGALGYNMEDTAVAIGMMANAGIKGEKAGTALRSILTNLSTGSGESKKAMEELGISLSTVGSDGQEVMKPLNEVIGDLRNAFFNLSEEQKTQYAKSIAGKNAMSGLLAIVNGAPEDFNKLTDAVNNSSGAAQSMADTMNDNVSGKITLLKSKVEGIMIKVFEKASDSIKKGVDSASKALDKIDWDKVGKKVGDFAKKIVDLFAWIIKNSSTIGKILKTVAGALAGMFIAQKVVIFARAISAMITTFKTLKTAIQAATTAQEVMNAVQMGTPWGLIAGAIGAVVGGIAMLATTSSDSVVEIDKQTEATNKLLEAHQDLQEELKNSADSREDTEKTAQSEGTSIDKLWEKINKLKDVEDKSNGQKKLMKEYVEKLNELVPDLNLKYDEEKDTLNKNTDAIKANIDARKEQLLAEAMQQNNQDILKDIAKLETDNAELELQLPNQEKEKSRLSKELDAARKEYDDFFKEYNKKVWENGRGEIVDKNTKEDKEKLKSLLDKYNETEDKYKAAERSLNDTKIAINDNLAAIKELNDRYDMAAEKIADMLDNIDASNRVEQELQNLTNLCAAAGIEVPETLARKIRDGLYTVPQTVDELNNLIKFDDAISNTNLAGTAIPESLSAGILNGDISVNDAITQLNRWVDFQAAVNAAGLQGAEIPPEIASGILSGEDDINTALEELRKATNQTDKFREQGKADGEAYTEGVSTGITGFGPMTKVYDAATDMSNMTFEQFHHEMQINSPSKRARDELGKMIPPGIAIGVEDAMPKATKSMRQTLGEAMSGLKSTVASANFALSPKMSNSNSRVEATTNKNIVFNQTINAPKDPDRLSIYKDTNNLLFGAKWRLGNA